MQGIIPTTPLMLAVLTTAPVWIIILMAVIIVALIVLLYRELWTLFTKLETGIVLFVIIAILSIVGGLLPQHLTQEDVAKELLGLPLLEVVDVEKAAELMEVPGPGKVPPGMISQLLGHPSPQVVTEEEAIKLMGITPAPGMSVQDTYANWLKRTYIRTVLAKYRSWFVDKVNEREQPFRTFYKIGFFMIYHTWYYLLIAYLLFITVLCCTIRRLSGFIKMRRREPHAWPEDRLRRQSEVVEFDFNAGELVDSDEAARVLSKKGLNPKACKKDGEGFQFNLGFGFKLPHHITSIIFHFAIFIALIGFLLTGYYSWRTEVTLKPGETKEINYLSPDMKIYKWFDNLYTKRGWDWANPDRRYDIEASFEIRCDDYWTEFIINDDGWYSFRDFKSDLTIVDGGREIKSKTIEVNYPLTYHGIDFYQLNVVQAGRLEITSPEGDVTQVEATIWGTEVPEIPGIGAMIKGSGLIIGTLLEKGGGKSDIGPTMRIGKAMPPKKEDWPNPGKPKPEEGKGMMGMGTGETEWLFVLEDGKPEEWNGFTFELKGPYSKATGLEVRHDPGVPVLWFSITVVIIMMLLRVYFPRYDARVDVSPGTDGGMHLIIAGRAYGLSANFKKRAERIALLLKSKGDA